MNKKLLFTMFFGAMSLWIPQWADASTPFFLVPDFDKPISGTITSLSRDGITISTTDEDMVKQVTEYLTEKNLINNEEDYQDTRPPSGRDLIIQMMHERRERENSLEESSDDNQEESVVINVLISQLQLKNNRYRSGDEIVINGKYESSRNVIIAREVFNLENSTIRKDRYYKN